MVDKGRYHFTERFLDLENSKKYEHCFPIRKDTVDGEKDVTHLVMFSDKIRINGLYSSIIIEDYIIKQYLNTNRPKMCDYIIIPRQEGLNSATISNPFATLMVYKLTEDKTSVLLKKENYPKEIEEKFPLHCKNEIFKNILTPDTSCIKVLYLNATNGDPFNHISRYEYIETCKAHMVEMARTIASILKIYDIPCENVLSEQDFSDIKEGDRRENMLFLPSISQETELKNLIIDESKSDIIKRLKRFVLNTFDDPFKFNQEKNVFDYSEIVEFKRGGKKKISTVYRS